MASVIKAVSFDAADAQALAAFWAVALGSDVDEDSTADKAFVEAARTSGSSGCPKVRRPRTGCTLPARAGSRRGRGGQA